MATVYEGDCSRAQTWVLTLSRTDPLEMNKLNGWALSNDVLFGMHGASGTVILAMAKAETQQHMLDKVRTMIKHAGGDPATLLAVKPLDVFHWEQWGCIDGYRTPKPPTVVLPSTACEESEEESPAEQGPARGQRCRHGE